MCDRGKPPRERGRGPGRDEPGCRRNRGVGDFGEHYRGDAVSAIPADDVGLTHARREGREQPIHDDAMEAGVRRRQLDEQEHDGSARARPDPLTSQQLPEDGLVIRVTVAAFPHHARLVACDPHDLTRYAAVAYVQSTSTATLRRSSSTETTSRPLSGRVRTSTPSTFASGPCVIRTRWPAVRYG